MDALNLGKPYVRLMSREPQGIPYGYKDLNRSTTISEEQADSIVANTTIINNITSTSLSAFAGFSDGTAVAPGAFWTLDTDTGFYRIGSNNVGASNGGALSFDWNAARLKLATGYKLYMGTSSNLYGGAGGTDDYLAGLDNVNYGVRLTLKNSNTGTLAYSAISTMNDQNNAVSAGIIGSGYTVPNIHTAGEGFLVMSDGGGLGGTLKGFLVANRLNSYLRFGTNDLERARILSSGQFLINATTVIGGEQLRVNGAIYCDTGITAITTISAATLSGTTVTASGTIQAANGTSAAPSYTFSSQTSFGIYRVGSSILAIGNGTAGALAFNSTTSSENLAISSTGTFSWSSGQNAATTGADLFLSRDAAAILALKNSTTAQTMRIYGSTSGSKYLSMAHDATNGRISTTFGDLIFSVLGTDQWKVDQYGDLGPCGPGFSVGFSDTDVASYIYGQSIQCIGFTNNYPFIELTSVGSINFSDGTNPSDVNIYRDGATLKADTSGAGGPWQLAPLVAHEGDLSLSDITTANSSTTQHGFLKKLNNVATNFMDGTGNWDSVRDSDLSMVSATTNDVTITVHGFCPTAPNDATKFLDGTGAWSVPAGGTSYLAGDGLLLTGSTFDVRPGDGIEISSDLVRVKLDGTTITRSGSGVKVTNAFFAPSIARVYRSTNQTISNATVTALSFDTEVLDTDSMYSGGSPTRITFTTAGYYIIIGHVRWTNAAIPRGIGVVWINGGDVTGGANEVAASAGTFAGFSNAVIYQVSAGDYAELVVYQNSGGSADIIEAEIYAARIG